MNSYELSRKWFDFCFLNPEKIRPSHSALYFFAIEHCNRLGWKEKFGFPTTMAMEAIGIKNYKTFISTLNELVEWKFIYLIERSKNQHSSNIIALVKNTKALGKALDKALTKHTAKQVQSTVSIDKPLNKEQTNNKQEDDIKFEDPLKTYIEQNPPEFTKEHNDYAIEICDYLNVPNPDSGAGSTDGFRYIRQAVFNMEILNKLDNFKFQFKYYKIAWEATRLKKHNYKNFIGSFDKKYEDGAWCSKNWDKEIAPETTRLTTKFQRYEN